MTARSDATAAALLLAVDPAGLGGCVLRARAGPERDGWLAAFRASLPRDMPFRRLPLHAADDRLLGGLDLTATLAAGRPVAERGLLAAADGGVVALPSAERVSAGTAARIGTALDTGEVAAERDGFSLRAPARVALVALDEGLGPDERAPAALVERLAFLVDLSEGPADGAVRPEGPRTPHVLREIECARDRLSDVIAADVVLQALCAAALQYGIASLRAPLFALRAARANAALHGRTVPDADDVALAARLVLGPRATCLPAETESQPQADGSPSPSHEDGQAEEPAAPPRLDDLVLAAVAAALPPGLLDGGRPGQARGGSRASGAGLMMRNRTRGRPAGFLAGEPARGARLNLVETLRAAAPWQRLRERQEDGRLAIRRADLRITRFKRRQETTTVFVVDASGSSAFGRLAEAKGAVELLLADCYVRRDKVALLTFRGTGADLLLPPTRSLTRARRCLSALPGGGGTPLATAIDAACDASDAIVRAGGSAVVVFLTDGRANVGRDGTGGREKATSDALAAARRIAAGPARTIMVDTSPRRHDAAGAVAAAMGARYVPLPFADARRLSGLVRQEIASDP